MSEHETREPGPITLAAASHEELARESGESLVKFTCMPEVQPGGLGLQHLAERAATSRGEVLRADTRRAAPAGVALGAL